MAIMQTLVHSAQERQYLTVAPRTDNPILSVDNLVVRYQQHIGCSGIHFQAFPGERIAVIGPNGAGKSTLFKALVRLHPIYSGKLTVDDADHHRGTGLISYVPQHESVDWNFPASVWDTVMMVRTRHIGPFLPPRRRDRRVVREALQQVELWHLRNRQIGQLSGGQRRRVFIARALAQEARIVLMDEPFVGVDATVEQELFGVLDMLRERQITVLIATHNLSQAMSHFDKVLMMNVRQVAYGPADTIFTPQNLSDTFGGRMALWHEDEQYMIIADHPCHDHDEDCYS